MTRLKQIELLKETIKYFRSQIEPHDCGWMYTTIDGLKHRINILRKEIKVQERAAKLKLRGLRESGL
jgi:hypothetical protein